MENYDSINEGKGTSFSDVFNVIKKKLWLVAVISVILAIVTGLVIMFGVNKKQETYTASFEIDYPDYKSGINPDGSTFYYQDMINLTSLNAAKVKSEKFSSINTGKLVSEKDISISRAEVLDGNKQVVPGRYVYTVKVSANYFPGKKTAEEYLRAVADSAIETVKDKISGLTYNVYVQATSSATSYADKINLLNSEKTAIVSRYDSLIARYNDIYTVEINGATKSLRELVQDVKFAFPSAKSNELLKELSLSGYTLNKDASESATILAEIKNYLDLHYANVKKLDMYKDIISSGKNIPDSDKFYSVISDIVNSNVSYEQKLDDLYYELAFLEKVTGTTINIPERYKSNADATALVARYDDARANIVYDADAETAFNTKLDAIAVALSQEAEKLKTATVYVYENNSDVSEFKFNLTNHTSTIMVTGVVFVLTFVIASAVVYFIGKNKYFDEKQEKTAEVKAE